NREPEVRPRLVQPAELAQRLAQRVVPVVRGRVDLEEALEGLERALGLARDEVRAAERLEDGALAGRRGRRPLQDDRGLGVVPGPLERETTLEQAVCGLAVVVRWRGGGRVVGVAHPLILARDAIPCRYDGGRPS